MQSSVISNNICSVNVSQGRDIIPRMAPDTRNVFISKGTDRSNKKAKLSNSQSGKKNRNKVGGCNYHNIMNYFNVRRSSKADTYEINLPSKRKADSSG